MSVRQICPQTSHAQPKFNMHFILITCACLSNISQQTFQAQIKLNLHFILISLFLFAYIFTFCENHFHVLRLSMIYILIGLSRYFVGMFDIYTVEISTFIVQLIIFHKKVTKVFFLPLEAILRPSLLILFIYINFIAQTQFGFDNIQITFQLKQIQHKITLFLHIHICIF